MEFRHHLLFFQRWLKLLTRWWTQYLWTPCGSVKIVAIFLLIPPWRSSTIHTLCWSFVTCSRKRCKNYVHVLVLSMSQNVKANGNVWLSTSYATAIRSFPVYFSYICVPMLISGRQCGKLWIESVKDKRTLAKSFTSIPHYTFTLIVKNGARIKMPNRNHDVWKLMKCSLTCSLQVLDHLIFNIPHFVVRGILYVLIIHN